MIEGTTPTLGLAGAIGFFLPLVIAMILKTKWSRQRKAVASFALCVVAAAGGSFLTEDISFTDPSFDWVMWLGAIYGTAMTMFARLWQPMGLTQSLEKRVNP